LSSRERFLIRTVLLGMLCLLPSVPAFTQSLTLPTLLFSGAAAADLATTYAGLSRDSDRLVETNPVLSVTRNRPMPTVALGAMLDLTGLWTWNHYVGRQHPKWAAAGLYAATAYRLWCARSNLRVLSQESSRP
jgi:hypothetical protein